MPALALSEALGNIGQPVHMEFFCGSRDVEKEIYANAGIKPHILPVDRFGSGSLFEKIKQGAGMALGSTRSLFKMHGFDVAVGMGGYVAASVLSAAYLARVPIVLHDSNSILGKVTRTLAPKARAIGLGMPLAKTPENIDPGLLIEVGTPVRLAVPRGNPQRAAETTYLRPDVFTLLIMGGSQGAKGLNNIAVQAIGIICSHWPKDKPLQVIWSTGAKNVEEVRHALQKQPVCGQFWIAPSIDKMEDAYALSDLVISRAGGSSLAELLICGLPSILFPLPQGADHHQHYNAGVLQRHKAALVMDEEQTQPITLAKAVLELASKPKQRETMSQAARRLSCPSAGRDLARLIVNVANGQGPQPTSKKRKSK